METIERYGIEIEDISIAVELKGEKGRVLQYNLALPELSPATAALVSSIKDSILSQLSVSIDEQKEPEKIEDIKEDIRKKLAETLAKKVPGLGKDAREQITLMLFNQMIGLGKIEFFLNDPNLEEVVIPSPDDSIRVYHKKYGWLITNVAIESESEIQNYANIIGRRIGKQITVLNPLLDANLATGERVNAVLKPITSKGNTITIRKFARDPWTCIDLINNKTIDSGLMGLLWFAVQYESNIIISGGTASGKTTFLNTLMPFIPANHRIISIEDTRELQLPEFLYWCPMVTRDPNPEGKGKVGMNDLLVNSLRMRPDRIVLGEVRKGEDAEVLFEAMHTGHSVYSTVHADSVRETIRRFINPPIGVPANLLRTVDLNLVMFRDRRTGTRRLYQIGEFIQKEDEETINANILYRLDPVKDRMMPHQDSLRFFETIGRHTGLSQDEIKKEVLERKKILDWMAKNNLRSLQQVGKVMHEYYLNPEIISSLVKSNSRPDALFSK